jgi:hypothetical protein
MNNMQLGTENKNNFTRILPDFYAQYQIKKSENLTYNFSFTNDFTDINKLAQGYILQSYSSLFRGNQGLENATSQVHSLRYFKYNMFNFENIFANASYTKRIDAVKSRAIFGGVNQFSTPYNSNFADETFNANANYGRSFLKYYKASVGASFSWANYYNIIANQDNSSKSITQNYTVKASTNFKKVPNLEIGYTYTLNEYNKTKFFTDKPFARLDYYFLDAFALVTEYEFYHYYSQDKTTENEYDFLSASLVYQKKDSKWEYKVSATNILNTNSLNDKQL